MRVDKLIVADSTKSSDEIAKDKSATLKHKLEEPVLDDLVISKAEEDDAKAYGELWPYDLKTIEREVLYQLLRKKRRFFWEEAHTKAIRKLKKMLLEAPTLRRVDYKCGRPVILTIDTSPTGIGWAIGQYDEEGHRTQIAKIQAQQGVEWQGFKKAMKEEYLLEDSQRVTKQSFMKWIKKRNKVFFARELLMEFEKRYDQLSATEQPSIRKKELADARVEKATKQIKPTTMEEARKIRMEKAKALQEEMRRLEVEKKAQEEAAAAQAAQTKEKEVVDLSGTIEHLKKIEIEKHMEEQRAAQLAREKIKET
ncbi:hypothetical protein L7F22_047045 [Adiantum nelumboides]|nr:hypothetical protein [Adiantum nelumboides]